jgi:hypothetical protein
LPLFEKARIEVYVPDLPKSAYQDLLEELDREFTFTFGGATVLRGLDGSYLSHAGIKMADRVTRLYTDTPFSFAANALRLSAYTDRLRAAVSVALEEEAILVVVMQVFHSV